MTGTNEGFKHVQSVSMAVALAVSMVLFERLEGWRDRSFSPWITVVVFASLIFLIIVPALIRRDLDDAAIGAATLPIMVGSAARRFVDPDPSWTDPLRAAGVMLVLVVVLVVVLTNARRVRELERLLFTEATSIAFFVTVVGATAYAGVQALLDAPQLSFAWISLFGFAVWGIAALLLRRRYT